jgi:hypothetical protein
MRTGRLLFLPGFEKEISLSRSTRESYFFQTLNTTVHWIEMEQFAVSALKGLPANRLSTPFPFRKVSGNLLVLFLNSLY